MPLRMAYQGQYIESTRIVWDGEIRDIATVVLGAGSVQPPPDPTAVRLLGQYNGGPLNDQQIMDVLGAYPDISSTYYQPTQTAHQANEIGRLNKGISPLLTFTSKNTATEPTGSQRLVDIANGDPTAIAWLDARINSCRTLSEQAVVISASLGFDVHVYMAMEHEYSVKSNPANGANYVITGDAETPAIAAAVQNTFIQRCRAIAPLVKPVYWEGGFRKSFIEDALELMTEAPDYVLLDLYTNGGAFETAAQCWAPDLAWMRANADYIRLGSPDMALGEFGIDLSEFSDAQGGVYYADVRQAMADADLAFALHFNSNSGPNGDHAFLVGDFPLTRQAFADSLTDGASPPPTSDLVAIGTTITSLGDPDTEGVITENSGLVVSAKNSGPSGRVLWGHNDQGTPARIFAVDDIAGSQIICTVTLDGVTNANQFEDISKGPGPDPDKHYLYVGQIGNNGGGVGGTRLIHRIEEPTVVAGQTPTTPTLTPVTFSYATPWADSEAMIVDPVTGDLFLFQKKSTASRPATIEVYRYAAVGAMTTSQTITGSLVATIRSHDQTTNNGALTAADISDDGAIIMVGNYQEMWAWNRHAGETVGGVLTAEAVGPIHHWFDPAGANTWGGEALAIDSGAQPGRVYGLSEGGTSSLKYTTLAY